MLVFAILVEPANYTLDLIKYIYEPRGIEFAFINRESQSSSVEFHTFDSYITLWQQLKSHDAIIINGYTGLTCLIAIWLNILFFRKPMAIDSDTELRIPANKLKRLAKWIWLHFLFTRKYCYGFAGGNYGHKELFRHYGMAEDRIFLMPMMVNNARYTRNLPDSPHKPFRFGYLGRLIPLKQVGRIIEALPDGVELHIVGDGPERASLAQIAHNKAVVFHGAVFGDDKVRLLHSFDSLVLYSLYESWGLVVNEALASGIPVIVSDKVGAKKDLVEGEAPTGLVAKWNNVDDLADKMQQIAVDSNLWKRLSGNALKRMSGWGYDLYGKQYDKFLFQIGAAKR